MFKSFNTIVIILSAFVITSCSEKTTDTKPATVSSVPKTEAPKIESSETPVLGIFTNEYNDSIELLTDNGLKLTRVLENEVGVAICQIELFGQINETIKKSEGNGFTVHYRYEKVEYESKLSLAKNAKKTDLSINLVFCDRMYRQYLRKANKDLVIEINSATHDVIELKNPLMTQMESDTSRFFYRKE